MSRSSRPSRSTRAALIVVGGAATATTAIALIPALQRAYPSAAAQVALETTATLVASLVAFLVFGRFRGDGGIGELLLVCGLGLLALSNFAFAALPPLVGVLAGSFFVWASIVGIGLAVTMMAASSFLPARRMRSRAALPAVLVLGVCGGLLLATIGLVEWLDERLPTGLPSVAAASGRPAIAAHPGVLGAQLLLGVVAAVGAVGFARRSGRGDDELRVWLAASCAIAALARLNYALYPSEHSRWVSAGDALRLLAYFVLVVGAAQEIRSYWAKAVEAARIEERRRVARDLHDGVAQELAFIDRNVELLRDPGAAADLVERISAATKRAKAESRQLIATLATRPAVALDVALRRAVTQVAARHGVALDLQLGTGVAVSPAEQEALVRISGEAVENAARHSGAPRVRIELVRREAGSWLRIVDEGRGFDTAATTPGFGLVSMRERADAVGARFRLHSLPGVGTRIEVFL